MGAASGVATHSTARRLRTLLFRHALRSPFSVRTHMVGLILAVVLPLLLFGAFLVLRSAQREEAVMASAVRETTLSAAASIDQELSILRARLFVLASSNELQTGDLAGFHAQAREAIRRDGLAIILSDPTGQELVDTRVPFGTRLPMAVDLDAIRRVSATGQPDTSGLATDPSTHALVLAMNVPVLHEGRFAYVLSLDIAPVMPMILAQLHLPADWIATIADRNGYTIARSHEANRFVGQMGRPAVLELLAAADEGWFPVVSREGVPLYNAFAHVKLSGWTISVGMPESLLYAPVRHSTWIIALAGTGTLALALLLAMAIARHIAEPITALVGYANIVGHGERIQQHTTGVLETDAVALSLHRAGERLHHSAAARDQVEEDLRRSEQNYRALAEDLARVNQERTELLHRTVTTQEDERRRIARELHDSLGQYLTALRLGFNAIEPHCAPDQPAQQQLAELKHLADELGRELNRIAWELRPMALDDLGLHRAVTQYLEEWSDRSRMHIDLAITLDERRLPAEVETALFRVLQEAITNVVKHAGATAVGVILEATQGQVRLIVEDNGRGFVVDNGAAATLGVRHLGLLGLRERLALVGGKMEVESIPDRGTTVYVTVPI